MCRKIFVTGSRPPDSQRGDADAAFGTGAARLEATYTTPIENHNPMEPHATVARWDDDKLIVWHATQGISGTQNHSRAVRHRCEECPSDLPLRGRRLWLQGKHLAASGTGGEAAKIVGRPVKLVVTRAQMFTSNGYRPETISEAELREPIHDGRLISHAA